MDMERLDEFMARLDRGQGLTRYEQLRLLMVVQLAAKVTAASDSGDDADDRLEDEGMADSGDTYDKLLDTQRAADDDYNRSKDSMFIAVRELLGWPGRAAKYTPFGDEVKPHPLAQEGTL